VKKKETFVEVEYEKLEQNDFALNKLIEELIERLKRIDERRKEMQDRFRNCWWQAFNLCG
jgi:hypothetical protein